MSDEKKVTNTDEEIVSTEETIASTREQKDNYEVGYGKPPKNTRFPKGASGNPSGRRKKGRDLDAELSKELNSTINIRENGKPKRISKVQGIIKRFANEALAGDIRAARFILTDYKELLEGEAVSAVQEAKELQRLNNIDELTTEELLWIAAGNDPKELLRRRKNDTS